MALQLRITIVSTGQTKAMRFTQTMSVSETLKEIKDKTGEGGRDHGLLRPADPKSGRTAKWMQLDRTLQFYDIRANEELLLKKKHRPLKVELADGTIKTFLVDDSAPVQDIVDDIGKKMGLRNPEEFSLRLRDEDYVQKGKKKSEAKMWLHPSQAIAEQGIADEVILQLKKKWYVDDANIDSTDPAQLHLVYVQSHEAIISGSHQVSKEEAYQFAALQCQIQYGNYVPEKHNLLFFKQDNRINGIVPKKYNKGKVIEEVQNEWKKIINQTDANAKYRYVQLCRSLKTYGITYYTVKKKIKGRKKLETVLVGVTRDNIMIVDPDSDEVKEEFPLIHLKRWAASPTSFTLDFGDYREEYLSVQTEEGDSISQLIAGYIDILLKRRRDGGVVVDEDEGEVAVEDFIGTIAGHAVQSITTSEFGGGLGDGATGSMLGGPGQVAGVSPGLAGMLGQVGSLFDADNAIVNLLNDLMCPIPIGSHGSKTPEMLRQELAKYNNALAAAAGALIKDANNGASRADLDKHSPALALNLAQLIGAAKLAAAASGGDVSLLDGAKAVSDAVRRLMTAAGNMADDPTPQNRAALAEAAALLQVTSAALNATAAGLLADEASKNLLLESAKVVGEATRDLLQTSQRSVQTADPPTKQRQVEGSAKVDWSNRKVDSTVVAVAPVVADPGCQKYLTDAIKLLSDSCTALASGTSPGIRDPQQRNDLARATKSVMDALQQLVDSTQCVSSRIDANREAMAAAAFQLQDAVAKVMSSSGNPQLIVASSVAVRDASQGLIVAAKTVATNTNDIDERQRLHKAMLALTNATKAMLASGTVSAKDPSNDDLHRNLREDASKVSDATRDILGDMTTKDAALAALRTSAKSCAAASSALIADARSASNNLDPQSRAAIIDSSAATAAVVGQLVAGVRASQNAPRDPAAERQLTEAASATAKPAAALVSGVRNVVPQVRDANEKKTLNADSQNVTDSLRKMLDALKAVKEADGHMEVEEALEDYKAAQADLDYAIISASQGTFEPLPGTSRDGAMNLLTLSTNALKSACVELSSSALISPQAMGPPAKKTTGALQQVFGAAKAVASTTDSRPSQTKILTAAKGVSTETERLINAGRTLSVNPTDNELQRTMNAAHDGVKAAIELLLAAADNAGAGAEECSQAGELITRSSRELLTGYGGADGDLQDFADELAMICKALDAAVNQVVDSARNNPKNLGAAASLTASTMPSILKVTNNAASKAPDSVVGQKILSAGKTLADDTAHLLLVAKSVTAAPDDYTAQQNLTGSAKTVRDDIQELLNSVDSAIPGKKEILEALALLSAAISRLGQPSVSSGNPQLHLREVQDSARVLADAVGRIVASARNFPERLGPFGKQAAESVSDIVDAAKDASSGDPACVVALSAHKLARDARKINDDPGDVSGTIDNAKDATRNASLLLQNVKRAAEQEKDRNARQQLILAAEQCAKLTEDIARAAKAVSHHEAGAEKRLVDAVNALEAKVKAVMAYHRTAGTNFRPLVDAAKLVAEETARMIEALKQVSGKPKDQSGQTQLAVAAKATTDGIKQLLVAAEELTFGHKECKEAIEAIQKAIGDLDATAINATVGILPPAPPRTTNQQCKEELIALSRDLAAISGRLVQASKTNPEDLGPSAGEISAVVPKIVDSSKLLAATTTDSDTQQAQLQLAKDVTDSLLTLVYSARETSGNPSDQKTVTKLADSAKDVSASITELVSRLKGGVLGLRACDEAIAAIEAALQNLGRPASGPRKTYAQACDETTKQARELVGLISKMATISKTDPEKAGDASKAVADQLPRLIEATNAALAVSTEDEVKQKLLKASKGVGNAARDSVSAAKNVAADPKNTEAIANMSVQQRAVTQALSELLNTLRQGATLERDADTAVAKINATMADLDSASLFVAATAGRVEVDLDAGQTLDSCQAQLSRDAKQIITVVSAVQKQSAPGAQGGQEALGRAFKDLAQQVDHSSKNAKNVASFMGDLVAQQDVLTAAKGACIASQTLILASKEAVTHPDDPAAQRRLADTHAATTAAVNEMIQVSEKASAEAVKGIREVEKAERDIIAQQNNFKNPSWQGNRNGKAEDVVKAVRVLGAASGNIVSTCTNDTEGLVKSARACAQGAIGLMNDGRGAGALSDDPKVVADLTKAINTATTTTLALLAAAKVARDTPESQKQMSSLSEKVADAILEVVGVARKLPGGAGLRLEEDTGDDLEMMAERELMKAAKMIEEAAKRLLAARPKKVKTSDKLDEQDINAAILDAARAITIAVSSLVGAATHAQRERIAKSKDPSKKHFYRKDPAWANGLISAAQAVGGTTQDLVTHANGFVKKEEASTEEMLIAAAKQIAAATARLMAASRAKSDPFSDSHKSLADASKAVAAATQALVDAARMAGQALNEPEEIEMALDDISVVQGRQHQLKVQAEMLRLEKELEKVRGHYHGLNKAQYGPGNSERPMPPNPGPRPGGPVIPPRGGPGRN